MKDYSFSCTLVLGYGVYVDDVEFGTFLRAWRKCKHYHVRFRLSVFVCSTSWGVLRHYMLSCDDPAYKLYGYRLYFD